MRLKMPAPGYIGGLDSATAMLRANARFLHGRDISVTGMPRVLKPLVQAANHLPRKAREALYSRIGASEGIPSKKLGSVDSERLARWTTSRYPRREYPAVMIGSSNGAAVHLCAALGIPWLPQTLLVPVRRPTIHPDDIRDDMEWGREIGRRLLDANPDLQLHQESDPNQDRMMIHPMSHFRTKRIRLGEEYERYLSECIEPGGTIFLLECGLRRPARRVSERHLFQVGATGGLEQVDGEFPEAEWGFEPALRDDVERFAKEKGFRVRRISFAMPEDLSPLVADLYTWWYRQRRITARRLIASSYLLMEPHWTLRTGSVPFWCKLAADSSADALEAYLERAGGFDEIGIMLSSHGTESAGTAPVERWRSILERARRKGYFLGVDEAEFPFDLAGLARSHDAVRKLSSRYPMPGPLTLAQLEDFLRDRGDRYPVQWLDSHARPGETARRAPRSGEGDSRDDSHGSSREGSSSPERFEEPLEFEEFVSGRPSERRETDG